MTALFDAQDLEDLLGARVETSTAKAAERVVWGWLKPVLELDERPAEISDEIWSAAVELGAIALQAARPGEAAPGDDRRRQAIIDKLAASLGLGGGVPQGDFPPTDSFYPDPARPWA